MSDLKQVSDDESDLIYNAVQGENPTVCLECGTSNGEGSTHAILQALFENGNGTLFTFEVHKDRFEMAQKRFNEDFPHLGKRVVLSNEEFDKGVEKLDLDVIDFAFLDGPNNAAYDLYIFQMIEPKVKVDGVVVLHDWNIKKCKELKKYIGASDQWIVEKVLKTKTGICQVRKVKS